MKAYFTAAIAQKDELGKNYDKTLQVLKDQGYEVIQDTTTTSFSEAFNKEDEERMDYYKKVLRWINKADLVVAEVSFPSTINIGHEITLALEKGKPVVALYLPKREPCFFLGLKSEKILWVKYSNVNDLEKNLTYALKDAKDQMDVRFNFFISPGIGAYLDWICKNKKIPRAVYLRRLIEEDMKRNKSYRA